MKPPEEYGVTVSLYPLLEEPRDKVRLSHYERVILQAVHEAQLWGLSLKCREGDHYVFITDDGCLNDGTSCICRCHDRRYA